MALNDTWHVRSRSRECFDSKRPFADGETIVTALYPDPESSGFLRRDYSEESWAGLPADAETPFSQWKSVFRAPNPEGREGPEEKLSPEELLRRLVEEDQDHTENTRYILSVMLERRKILRETDHQRTPGGILRVYEHRKTGEVFLIRDPDIPLDQAEAVQNEVLVLLENNGRLPEPDPEPEPPSASETEATPETDAQQETEPTPEPPGADHEDAEEDEECDEDNDQDDEEDDHEDDEDEDDEDDIPPRATDTPA